MKKYLLGLFAVVLAIGFTAFTTTGNDVKASDAKFVDVWYEYVGSVPSTPSDLANPANYEKFTPQPSNIKVTCPLVQYLCAVTFPDNGFNLLLADVLAK